MEVGSIVAETLREVLPHILHAPRPPRPTRPPRDQLAAQEDQDCGSDTHTDEAGQKQGLRFGHPIAKPRSGSAGADARTLVAPNSLQLDPRRGNLGIVDMCDRITQRGVDPEALYVFPFTGSDPPRGSMKSASGKMLSEMPSKEKPGIPMGFPCPSLGPKHGPTIAQTTHPSYVDRAGTRCKIHGWA